MSHIKTWACIKPGGDGCDGDHADINAARVIAQKGSENIRLRFAGCF